MRKLSRHVLAFVAVVAVAAIAPARAEPCPPEKFAAAIDGAGASLRRFNNEAQPKLREKLKTLADKKGWAGQNFEETGYQYLQDDRIAAFDAEANELLSQIDSLGKPEGGGTADCAALSELQTASTKLLETMRAKSGYMLGKIDKELGAAPPADVAAAAPKAQTPTPSPPKPAETKEAGETARTPSWKTTTSEAPESEIATGPALVSPPSPDVTNDDTGYTIDEIRDATKGFFGSISTNLASVLEHAFSVSGRPTAYVLGKEGGGALLAGLRYGEGTLFLRTGGTQKVYWHGPTLGTDIGAAGSRTLFLIYKLTDPQELYRSFTGVDGSAYFVGGVGITLMKGGRVIMAPVRSGMGLRLGANIGYVRFTPRPTWNPF